MIYINPNSSAENSAHSSKRGSRAGIDVEEDGDEAEEARLRSMLLKQIGRKRSKSRDSKKGDFSNPDSPNTVMINPVKINPTVMHRKCYSIDQPVNISAMGGQKSTGTIGENGIVRESLNFRIPGRSTESNLVNMFVNSNICLMILSSSRELRLDLLLETLSGNNSQMDSSIEFSCPLS